MVLEVLSNVLCVWDVYNLWRYMSNPQDLQVLEVLGYALCTSGCSGYLQSGEFWVILYCTS